MWKHTHTLVSDWWRKLGYLLSSFLRVCLSQHDTISKNRCSANKPWKLHTHGNKSSIYRTTEILFLIFGWKQAPFLIFLFLSAPVRHHLHRPAAGAEVRRAGVHPRLHQDLSRHAGLVPRLHLHAVQCPHSAGHDSYQVGGWTTAKLTGRRHSNVQMSVTDLIILA